LRHFLKSGKEKRIRKKSYVGKNGEPPYQKTSKTIDFWALFCYNKENNFVLSISYFAFKSEMQNAKSKIN